MIAQDEHISADFEAEAEVGGGGGGGGVLEAERCRCALHSAIGELSFLDRLLVAMHYGVGLSQGEIATRLTIPPETIYHRLRRSVHDLGAVLARNGISGELDPARLSNALCSGSAAPGGLLEKIHHRAAGTARPARSLVASAL